MRPGSIVLLTTEELEQIYGSGRFGDALDGAARGGFSGGVGGAAAATGSSIGMGALGGAVGGAVAGGINGAMGGGGGSSGRSRVICTHFFRKGMLDRDLWRADLEYTFAHLSPETIRGYQYWAIPYVRLMRKSRLAERVMYPLAKYRALEIAHQMGLRPKGSLRGKIIRRTLEPLCFVIGRFVGEQNWRALWQDA